MHHSALVIDVNEYLAHLYYCSAQNKSPKKVHKVTCNVGFHHVVTAFKVKSK